MCLTLQWNNPIMLAMVNDLKGTHLRIQMVAVAALKAKKSVVPHFKVNECGLCVSARAHEEFTNVVFIFYLSCIIQSF